ncbi:nucleotide-diphospho-sugar transferase [Eremomyces bilateralis CBS 781.70]|uniref:Nucleotide-diphospho-sugar transferase n=1 Tax=Eremomyces bilateralis CBS 781.70 TaxID=1392243 RepID=A0A6G1FWG0_9PEZI|nr:nucleotide-diphospho-sugar transferase [Eremomyces bilateralis CBS 781.70]KAF1810026.1 nucleotide-diphospho-sugar transferase [Eremomyces bilateralis CBS 781.70]
MSFPVPRALSARSRLICILSFFFLVLLVVLHQSAPYHGYTIIQKPVPAPAPSPTAGEEFIETKFMFQEDLATLRQPNFDLKEYTKYKPHNYVPDTQQQTFATFLCTPNASIYDPYFAATLNLVYRNLWSPSIASKSRPFTVFVAPFITQEQRDILAGAGAVIQELGLLPWEPHIPGVWGRWRDQFSKLHFFNQTQYSTIAYMDSDAFPLENIDSVFDEIIEQKCDPAKLNADDLKEKDELCDYTFMGVMNMGGGINGGFVVVRPNPAMHRRLIRNYVKVDEYDNTAAEQSFFKWMFAEDGAFPVAFLPRKFNGYFPTEDDKGQIMVVHEKLWAFSDLPSWLMGVWDKGWEEMVDYFNSPAFKEAREKDGAVS